MDRSLAYVGGSSPRVWGTDQPVFLVGHHGRFIPTCVGNGHNTGERRNGKPVHPHVCGERISLSMRP